MNVYTEQLSIFLRYLSNTLLQNLAVQWKRAGRISWESSLHVVPVLLQNCVIGIGSSKRKGIEKTEQEVKSGPFWKLKLSSPKQEINFFLIMMAAEIDQKE